MKSFRIFNSNQSEAELIRIEFECTGLVFKVVRSRRLDENNFAFKNSNIIIEGLI